LPWFVLCVALVGATPALGQEIPGDDPAVAKPEELPEADPQMTKKTRRASHLIALGVSLVVGSTIPMLTIGRDCIGEASSRRKILLPFISIGGLLTGSGVWLLHRVPPSQRTLKPLDPAWLFFTALAGAGASATAVTLGTIPSCD
jgi:hypothetical protein